MSKCKVWVPAGALGAPFAAESIDYALSLGIDAIAMDAGSTDSGPYYLGTSTTSKSDINIRRDLHRLMIARQKANVPFIVCSVGQCGTDERVDWIREMCLEIAREENMKFKLATIYSEQDKDFLKKRLREGRVKPLPNAPEISEEVIDGCSHIVGAMGVEPIMEALENGADIILGGRSTDTAIIAAVPLRKGIPEGIAWHAAKIGECGSQCTYANDAGGIIISYDEKGFEVEPSLPDGVATPYTVAAHMCYENADPYVMTEPGGVLDTTNAIYSAVDHRKVRVEGSEFKKKPMTIKLEGAALVGYQSTIMVGITEPHYIANIDQWQEMLLGYTYMKVEELMGYKKDDDYVIELRRYGIDGVAGNGLPEGAPLPHEIAVLMIITANTQEMATAIVKLANPFMLHMPLTFTEEMPAFAFAFSPAQVDRGPVYKFALHHVVEVDDYKEMIKNVYINVE